MLWGAVCTDSLLVRPCVLLAAHRALQLLKVLGVSFFSNGGHPLRAAAVSRLPAFPGKCQLAASRLATSGGYISSDQMRELLGIRGSAMSLPTLFPAHDHCRTIGPYAVPPNNPWMPNRLGCSDDLNLVLVDWSSPKAVSYANSA